MHIIDMHCDTLLECYLKKEHLRENSLHVDLRSMERNHAMAQFFAIFLPAGNAAQEIGIKKEPYELFLEIFALYQTELQQNQDVILPALSYENVMENHRNHKMSSILTIEDGQLLEGDIQRLDLLYEKGVRLMTLTWNNENQIGFPSSADQTAHGKGLKPFGIETVERMNQLGMIIDVSHLSEGGFYDVARYSEKPFVASHSCARELCDHPRNLTDQQLKCVARSGGAVGINFYAPFLREQASGTLVKDIIAHMKHMISIMGDEHIALGSDFDGMSCGMEIERYDSYGELLLRMEQAFSTKTVERICYKNALRILKECL